MSGSRPYLNGQNEAVAEDNYGDVGDGGNTDARDLSSTEFRSYYKGDGPDYIITIAPYDDGKGSDALVFISSDDITCQLILYMEDNEFGSLFPENEYVEAGTITFVPDGIELEYNEHPEFNGLYQ